MLRVLYVEIAASLVSFTSLYHLPRKPQPDPSLTCHSCIHGKHSFMCSLSDHCFGHYLSNLAFYSCYCESFSSVFRLLPSQNFLLVSHKPNLLRAASLSLPSGCFFYEPLQRFSIMHILFCRIISSGYLPILEVITFLVNLTSINELDIYLFIC